VVVSDPADHRRALAARFGATDLVDPTREELLPAFERATGHAPRLAFECVGRPGVVQSIAQIAARGAKILSAGMCMAPDQYVPLVFGTKELSLVFSSYYRMQDYALTLAMLEDGRIDPLPMVTDRIGLDELPGAFERLRRPTTECKVIVQP
jgi:(R,R)-butanediol dehydrogenase/meso-butanediol dehydrogenase/diacetyl reductase